MGFSTNQNYSISSPSPSPRILTSTTLQVWEMRNLAFSNIMHGIHDSFWAKRSPRHIAGSLVVIWRDKAGSSLFWGRWLKLFRFLFHLSLLTYQHQGKIHAFVIDVKQFRVLSLIGLLQKLGKTSGRECTRNTKFREDLQNVNERILMKIRPLVIIRVHPMTSSTWVKDLKKK